VSRRRLLDTCRLIRHWYKCKGKRAQEDCTNEDAIVWARSLIDLEGTDAIVTPVAVEFLCGS
jgi:hypothetical protein